MLSPAPHLNTYPTRICPGARCQKKKQSSSTPSASSDQHQNQHQHTNSSPRTQQLEEVLDLVPSSRGKRGKQPWGTGENPQGDWEDVGKSVTG